MRCTSKCTNQVYELAPPTCVLKILIDSLPFIFLPLCQVLSLCPYLCEFLLPFVINDHKGSILERLRLPMSNDGVRIIFSNLVQYRTFVKGIQLGLIQGQVSSHLISRVILYHVELNTYSSFSRSNTRFTSPQTCHMLPLDQVKHISNSGTIQTSKSFDFHE